jgi:hypothetical protein
MRSDLCAGSYTFRTIFSPLEPDRAESVLSKAGSLAPALPSCSPYSPITQPRPDGLRKHPSTHSGE